MSKAVPRPFGYVAFDWDGTAVASREVGAADHLVSRFQILIERSVLLYVVTGTTHEWPARQLQALPERAKKGFFICCNRGSEVYRLGPGQPVLLDRRASSLAERAALDAAATALVAWLASFGISAGRIDGRLNRIKVDLIPIPEWADPPKTRIGELQRAVEVRLAGCGGLSAAMDTAAQAVAATGLDLRITSDVKHIEIGLTDKTHSMAWINSDISRRGGEVSQLLVVGDEFGPIGGVQGSDANTIISGAHIVSVGTEPNGVPNDVALVGGGKEGFSRILDELISVHSGVAA